MQNDGMLATSVGGVSGDEMFANNTDDLATKEAQTKEQALLLEILPTAEQELALLDLELTRLNVLTDFFAELGTVSTDVSEVDLRSKLQARFGYVNYLLNRRSTVLGALESAGKDTSKYDWMPPSLEVRERIVTIPRLTGWRAIGAGIADLFRRKPM